MQSLYLDNVKALNVSAPRGDSVHVATSVCEPKCLSYCAVSTTSQVCLQRADVHVLKVSTDIPAAEQGDLIEAVTNTIHFH